MSHQVEISPALPPEDPIDSSITLKQFVIERNQMINLNSGDVVIYLMSERLSESSKREMIDQEYI